jgi:hypothetical protein
VITMAARTNDMFLTLFLYSTSSGSTGRLFSVLALFKAMPVWARFWTSLIEPQIAILCR